MDLINELSGHNGAIYDLVWDGENWISAGGDGVVAQWKADKQDGNAIFHHAQAFYCIAVMGNRIVAGNASGELYFSGDSQGPTPDDKANQTVIHGKGSVFSLYCNPSGDLLAGGEDGNITCWSEIDGKITLIDTWTVRCGKIRSISSHPEGCIVCSEDGFWRLMDFEGNILDSKHVHDGSCYGAVWDSARDQIISVGRDGKLVASKVHSKGSPNSQFLSLPVHKSAIYRVIMVGELIWTASRDKTVKCWSAIDFKPVSSLKRRSEIPSINSPNQLPAHNRSVNALAIGGDDKLIIASGGDDRIVRVWS